MKSRLRRHQTVERILGEIGESVDGGDRVATMVQIVDARSRGEITRRDAERLVALLAGVFGGPLSGLRALARR